MKILIHSNAPWVGSGYGHQTRLLIPQLLKDGHEVVVSAINGLHGGEISWMGSEPYDADVPVRVLGAGQFLFGVDTLIPYILDEKPDLVLTIMDVRMLGSIAQQLQGAPLACWVPTDTSPLSRPEQAFLAASQARPIAMTRWGEAQLRAAEGVKDPRYVPHAVDTGAFSDLPDNEAAPKLAERERLGIPEDAFVIGMVAANMDSTRKGFPEQFEAFRRIRAVNEKAHLVVHSVARSTQGINLEELALQIGIADDVSFSQPLPQITGRIDSQHMATLYRAMDVLSICSYAEGFGVPMIEAMSCGTPLVTTDFGAMKEVGGPGAFLVAGEPFWNPVHQSWWFRPSIDSIASGYRYFTAMRGKESAAKFGNRCRARALQYDVDVVFQQGWRPFLAEWEASR